jgi:hypothetical protein
MGFPLMEIIKNLFTDPEWIPIVAFYIQVLVVLALFHK